MTSCRNFPSNKKKVGGIKCLEIQGPRFTITGNNRLSADSGPFNKEKKCISWAGGGYDINIEDGKNMLTN
jgi:hypothetical protein